MIKTITIDSIYPDPTQPRKTFDEDHIKGLMISLAQEGMINAIEVDLTNKIITGECRWRAAKRLHWEQVPINVNDTPYTEYERLRHQMAENLHQAGSDVAMNPMDTAQGYARLLSLKTGKKYDPGMVAEKDLPIKELARELGIEAKTIWEHLRLLEQPEFVQQAIAGGTPRTYFREADKASAEVQHLIKQKIAEGDYASRDQIIRDVEVSKQLPDLVMAEIERRKDKEHQATNRILDGVINLALAIEKQPLNNLDPREQQLVLRQLGWLKSKIKEYIAVPPDVQYIEG